MIIPEGEDKETILKEERKNRPIKFLSMLIGAAIVTILVHLAPAHDH